MKLFWYLHGGVDSKIIPRQLILREQILFNLNDFKQPNIIIIVKRLGMWSSDHMFSEHTVTGSYFLNAFVKIVGKNSQRQKHLRLLLLFDLT